jgi:hypothetical protein
VSFPEEQDPTPDVADDTRSDIEAAFDQHEAEAEGSPPAPDAPPPPPLEGEPGEAHPSGDGRVRDEAGRFAKKTKAAEAEVRHGEPAPKAAPGTPGAVAAPGEPTSIPGPKVPASWKPEVRAHWDKLPVEVRQEVNRREAQVQAALTESASARNIADQFLETINPYMGFIRAENANPMQAVDNLFKTAIALRTAPPGHKAQLVAGLVKEFGIDLSMLDSALAGQAMPPQAMQGPQVDPRQVVQEELNRFKQGLMQERQQQAYHASVSEVEQWAQGKEFYEDVRTTMADIMDLKAQQGVDLTLDEAYSMAVQMHPEHSKVYSQRQAALVAQTAKAATAKARAAASSVRSSPTLGVQSSPSQSGDTRDDIAAAWEELAGR